MDDLKLKKCNETQHNLITYRLLVLGSKKDFWSLSLFPLIDVLCLLTCTQN